MLECSEVHVAVVCQSLIVRTLKAKWVDVKKFVVQAVIAIFDSQCQAGGLWACCKLPKTLVLFWHLHISGPEPLRAVRDTGHCEEPASFVDQWRNVHCGALVVVALAGAEHSFPLRLRVEDLAKLQSSRV